MYPKQRGQLLMSVSNCSIDENGKAYGGKDGDNNGKEWRIRSWYSYPWNVVLRYPDAKTAQLIADLARKTASNDKVGYNQHKRLTYWEELQKAEYKPENVKTACNADCSSGACSIIKAVGYLLDNEKLKGLSANSYTGNMKSRLRAVGFEVLTDAKYLNSDKYLRAGDVLLKEGSHTCINLDNGKSAGEPTTASNYTKMIEVSLPQLKKGDSGEAVVALQVLLMDKGYSMPKYGADGDLGTETETALKAYQKAVGLAIDGVCGVNTWESLINGKG